MKIKSLIVPLLAVIMGASQTGCQSQYSQQERIVSAKSGHRAIAQKQANIAWKIRDYIRSNDINGSIAILKGEKILFNEGAGFSNFNKRMTNTAETTYPIGSITKSIVAVSVIQLQEKGKLNVLDPISKYIPDFPNGDQIKLLHLLNHTSGVKTPIILNRDPKPSDIMQKIVNDEVKFPAGSKWDYNDINYFILGLIVEKTAGEPLHDYIQKNIFDKAMMHHSGFMTTKNPAPYRSVGYVKAGRQVILAPKLNIPLLFGCGDIYSTVLDLCLFDQALMGGKLISTPSVKKMLTPGSTSSYGLGVYNKGNRYYSRGVLSGFESIHAYYHDKTAIAILLNTRDKQTDIHKMAEDLYQLSSNS
ncbi:beta-lactamase family protein [Bacillus sp. BRMEA1]|uniref:serine hydrolase domain-containing protein n=1 Tax=Neobacillus endophyticus TaxID=2738405 RepID=UPI00156569EE|nr:serine hydrolase domain-containing protein [Neobacillus endophyticus]NRD76446.1 beta-lactamase family protein [Neobacillus endophyticus]